MQSDPEQLVEPSGIRQEMMQRQYRSKTMTIDLTPDEAKFILDNIAQLTIPMNHPEKVRIATLGESVLAKLHTALTAPPLTSAAKSKEDPK